MTSSGSELSWQGRHLAQVANCGLSLDFAQISPSVSVLQCGDALVCEVAGVRACDRGDSAVPSRTELL